MAQYHQPSKKYSTHENSLIFKLSLVLPAEDNSVAVEGPMVNLVLDPGGRDGLWKSPQMAHWNLVKEKRRRKKSLGWEGHEDGGPGPQGWEGFLRMMQKKLMEDRLEKWRRTNL